MKKKIPKLLTRPVFWIGLTTTLIIIFLFSQPPKIKIIQTYPKTGSKGILATEKILVTFNRIPSTEESKDIAFKSNPPQSFNLNWQGNTVELIPTAPYKESTNYTINVSFKNINIYKISFETSPISASQIDKDIQSQGSIDFQFGQTLQKFYEENPWYSKIPVETNDYRVVYDFEYKKFRIRILKKDISASEEKNYS